MRGEKPGCVLLAFRFCGSPPHARGKVIQAFNHLHIYRITPACAGKSFHPLVCIGQFEDHPRMRGEKKDGATRISPAIGSPPHARGKVVPSPNLYHE